MGGASKYLANLPSRGLFSSSSNALSCNLTATKVYICDHDTSPPEEQLIKTDSTNILIRSLQLNKQKSELKDFKSKAASGSKNKRIADKGTDGRAPAKKANKGSTSASPTEEGSGAFPSERELQNWTVERLRSILKEKGMSARGKKDELISRLRDGET